MSAPWWIEMRAEQLILELREILVRYDENLAAHHLMQECVPYFLDDVTHPQIARARADQAAMVDHIVGESYAHYYETNHHERPFEEQYPCSAEDAHNHLHRVRFLRRWVEEQVDSRADERRLAHPEPLALLDVACNDGWMAKNLERLVTYTGIDLNPHCIERAKGRKVQSARFEVGFAEDALRLAWMLQHGSTKAGDSYRQYDVGFAEDALRLAWVLQRGSTKAGDSYRQYDVVVAYELVEHVKDPAELIEVMVSVCKPGGSLFVSTPLGAGTGGDLPMWHHVEPKGHVRAYTPQSFGALLAGHGETHVEISETQGAGQLMVARVDLPGIVEACQPASTHLPSRASRRSSPASKPRR